MNARASVVDSWRLIQFNANDLESDLNLVFSGDIGNVGDNPFDLRGTNGRLRVGLQFDAPLTRLARAKHVSPIAHRVSTGQASRTTNSATACSATCDRRCGS